MKNLKNFFKGIISIIIEIFSLFGITCLVFFRGVKNLFASKKTDVLDEAKFVTEQLTQKLKNNKSAKLVDETEAETIPAESEAVIEEAPPVEIKPKTYTREELIALEKKEVFSSYLETKSFYMMGVSISGKDHSIPKVVEGELSYMPCQDYYKIDNINNYNIIVCADGAGSAANSLIGSQFITETTVLELKKYFNSVPNNLTKKKWEELLIELLYRVRNRLKTFAIENEIPFESLASTINITVFNTNTIYYGHIGDGRSCYLTNNIWKSLITPWKGAEANLTVFITSPIWNDPYSYIKTDIITCDTK